MIRITEAFKKGKAFIPFITGGDPDLDTTRSLILEMQDAGADLIEIGVPFSDPIAEGPVIQEADERALQGGCTTDRLFDMVESLKDQMHIPMVFMTYINPVFSYGMDRFMDRCQRAGIAGLIVPDLPYEEKGEIYDSCHAKDLELVSMIAPTSKERIRMIAGEAEGFLYCVSSLGVTGVRQQFDTDIESMIKLAKEETSIPCCVGFGISTPEQAGKMASISDGAIVGSAIVRIIAEHGKDSAPYVRKYVEEMVRAVKDAG